MKSWLKKAISVSLCAAFLGGTAVTLPAVAADMGSPGIVANATDTQTTASGLEYTVNYNNTVSIVGYSGTSAEVSVPAEIDGCAVTEIRYNAFKNNTTITKVVIPGSVTSIGDSAFQGCTSLKTLTLGEGVTDIGDSAFNGCKALTGVTFPKTVETVDYSAFKDCISLKSAVFESETDNYGETQGIKTIGMYAFKNCKLQSVSLPKSLKSMSIEAFNNNAEMTSAVISNGSIGNNAFQGCTALKTLTLGEGVTEIGDSAFNGCKALTGVTFPKTVETVDYSAFKDCISLKSAVFESETDNYGETQGIKTIGMYAFKNCKLQSVSLPKSLKSMSSEAFYNNAEMTSAVISNGSIGNNAFQGCTALKTLTLGEGVTDIGDSAFNGCKALTGVTFPKTVETVDYSAFKDCISLKSAVFESETDNYGETQGIKTIGMYAFKNCKIQSVSLPKSLKSMSSEAFYNNAEMTSAVISSGSIGNNAFQGCTALKTLTLGEGVTDIGDSAFNGCKALTGVTFPKTVETVDYSAFKDCISLTSAVFESETDIYGETQGIKTIGMYAFKNCKIQSVSLPKSLESIGNEAFYNNVEMTSAVISSGSIGGSAFQGCTALKTLTLKDGVTEIGNSAFQDCRSVAKVIIPASVGSIDSNAFNNCSSLSTLRLYYTTDEYGESTGVQDIGYSAFNKCTSLKTVMVPHTVTNIGSNAFSDVSIIAKTDTEASAYAQENNLTYSSTLTNYSVLSSTSVKLGGTININAMAVGGSGDYTYALQYKKSSDSTWSTIGTKYGKKSTGSFKPKAAGTYDVRIIVKDGSGTTAAKTTTVTVNDENTLVNNSWINAEKVQIGDDIRVTGVAEGGSGGYKYAFYFKRRANSKWNKIGEEFGTKTYGITVPKAAADYDMKVVVKDSKGNTAQKIFRVTVVESLPLTNISLINTPTDISVGKTVTIAGRQVGGAKPFTYEFYFKRSTNSKWNKLSYGSEKKTYAKFTPTTAAQYDLKAVVIDSEGTKAEKTYKITAT